MKASPVHAIGRAHSHCTRTHLDTQACTRLCVYSVQLEGNTTNQQWWLQWTGICWDRINFNYKLFHPILYHMKVKVLVAQSCPTLCDPMDCSLPGSSVCGILQGRILEWVAIPFFRGSSRLRDQTRVSYIAGRSFTIWATREAHLLPYMDIFGFPYSFLSKKKGNTGYGLQS